MFDKDEEMDELIKIAKKEQHDAFVSGLYFCYKCEGSMEFEDESELTLICPNCGHSVITEEYGFEGLEEYDIQNYIYQRKYKGKN